jgi:hypothetical protein
MTSSTTNDVPQPVAIYLPFRNAPLIDKLLIDVDNHVKSLPIRPPNMIVKVEGLHDTRHFYEIPAVKKLFVTAIDKGLLGLLTQWGYDYTAKLCYAIAYIKPKNIEIVDGDIGFPLIKKDWNASLSKSIDAFNRLKSSQSSNTVQPKITQESIDECINEFI